MMSLLPDEAGLHLFLIHLCPSDVFCLPSQIPLALLKVRSLCRFILPYWKSGPSVLLKKITCIAGNQVPSVDEKVLEGSKEA